MKHTIKENFLLFLAALMALYWALKDPDVYGGCQDADRSAKCITWGAIK